VPDTTRAVLRASYKPAYCSVSKMHASAQQLESYDWINRLLLAG